MKRTLLVVSLCMVASMSFAQKKAVKEAKSLKDSNTEEARTFIKQALVDPETKDDQDTWKLAGDIEYTLFEKEFDKEQTKAFTKEGGDEAKMYEGLLNLYDPYLKADSLGQLPNEKGKVKNKVRKDIVKKFKVGHPWLINGGVYYSDKKEFDKATDFFERYWSMPQHEMFEGKIEDFNLVDTTYQVIKYYAIISCIQAEQHERAIKLLNKINDEGYVNNSTFKESDPYELLSSEYNAVGDSVAFVKSLRAGAEKFPSNQYFTPNLINAYIRADKMDEALAYIDQAIQNDPANSCDLYSVKASLFAEQKDYTKSEEIYREALANDPNCARSLEGLGVIYIVQAQEVKNKAAEPSVSRKDQIEFDKEAIELYKKALPNLEKFKSMLDAKKADGSEMRLALIKLQNVYYNLNMADELEKIDTALKEIEQ